jgi:hypothetical protein
MTQLTDTILMVRPAAFHYNPETAANNFFQNEPSLQAGQLQKAALREFDGMVALLRSKDIDVIVIDDTPTPAKPDAVFPNNWLSTNSRGVMNVYPMYARSRREEKRDDILQQLYKDYNVTAFYDWTEYEAENMFLEGTGSMVALCMPACRRAPMGCCSKSSPPSMATGLWVLPPWMEKSNPCTTPT